jgi:RNA-directed DNA polymerase
MSLGEARSPNGGVDSQRVIGKRPLHPVSMQEVVSRETMRQAWKQVKANAGAPGVDDITIQEFLSYAKAHWEGIKASLLNGTYRPHPVKRVEIPKDRRKTRPLGIPTVMDRVIQQAISQVLTPVFDPHFSESSFGFRPHRSAHQAVKKVVEDIHGGYRYAVEIDLEKFFDRVDHDVLMNRVSRRIRDKGILRLIGRYLRAGVVVNGRLNETSKGVPQGGPLTPPTQ